MLRLSSKAGNRVSTLAMSTRDSASSCGTDYISRRFSIGIISIPNRMYLYINNRWVFENSRKKFLFPYVFNKKKEYYIITFFFFNFLVNVFFKIK